MTKKLLIALGILLLLTFFTYQFTSYHQSSSITGLAIGEDLYLRNVPYGAYSILDKFAVNVGSSSCYFIK